MPQILRRINDEIEARRRDGQVCGPRVAVGNLGALAVWQRSASHEPGHRAWVWAVQTLLQSGSMPGPATPTPRARRAAALAPCQDLPPPPKTAIAGPEYFGLNQPEIVQAIEALDPGHRHQQYW